MICRFPSACMNALLALRSTCANVISALAARGYSEHLSWFCDFSRSRYWSAIMHMTSGGRDCHRELDRWNWS